MNVAREQEINLIRNSFSNLIGKKEREDRSWKRDSHPYLVALVWPWSKSEDQRGRSTRQTEAQGNRRKVDRFFSGWGRRDRLQLALANFAGPANYSPEERRVEGFLEDRATKEAATVDPVAKVQACLQQPAFKRVLRDLSRGCSRSTLCHEQFPRACSTWLRVV
ncbi:hypothetical protein K0M31_018882 [Melipona bicolor]|uniref:Uncharacterized protein n=1 Tax=Melipona bicolor TaxID=60889 RepID=A0AA40G452_9HYME|nr:hypothetical protein K0M31_018882 [Melipona bicolor]